VVPDPNGPSWIELPLQLDTDGEPPLIGADGELHAAMHLTDPSVGPSAGWSLVVAYRPGERTRPGTGYRYSLTIPMGPSTKPEGVSTNGGDSFTATINGTEQR
jgi:hypothetical protein